MRPEICETKHKSSSGVHRKGTRVLLHHWQINVENCLIILNLLLSSQSQSSTEHMWISFWIYHMLKHNYTCVKLVLALSTPSSHVNIEPVKAGNAITHMSFGAPFQVSWHHMHSRGIQKTRIQKIFFKVKMKKINSS